MNIPVDKAPRNPKHEAYDSFMRQVGMQQSINPVIPWVVISFTRPEIIHKTALGIRKQISNDTTTAHNLLGFLHHSFINAVIESSHQSAIRLLKRTMIEASTKALADLSANADTIENFNSTEAAAIASLIDNILAPIVDNPSITIDEEAKRDLAIAYIDAVLTRIETSAWGGPAVGIHDKSESEVVSYAFSEITRLRSQVWRHGRTKK